MASSRLVVCPECGGEFESEGKRNFLGFGQHTCTHCSAPFQQPLGPIQRSLYIGFLLVFGGAAVLRVLMGRMPSSLMVLACAGIVVALIADARLLLEARRARSADVSDSDPSR